MKSAKCDICKRQQANFTTKYPDIDAVPQFKYLPSPPPNTNKDENKTYWCADCKEIEQSIYDQLVVEK